MLIALQLLIRILYAVKYPLRVKPLLVYPVYALYLAIVPRRHYSDSLGLL